MRKQVDAQYTVISSKRGRWYKAKERWEKDPDRSGEPFDPAAAYLPPAPPEMDAKLTDQHHAQHYVVGRLEREMEAARKAENTL